nr:hypothetical protein [Cardiobacterium hominis]
MTHASLHGSYRRGTDRRLFLLAATALVLLALALADLATGPSGMPLDDIFNALRAGPFYDKSRSEAASRALALLPAAPAGLESLWQGMGGVFGDEARLRKLVTILWGLRMP